MDYLDGDNSNQGHSPPSSPDDPTGQNSKPDRYGEEMAEDANIWRVYTKVAKEADNAMVEWWNRGLDNLAVFAGLFSAATIAFIIEVYKDMKPDFAELSFRVQTTNASHAQMLEETFTVSPSARLVNSLWISSLLLSLSAAMIAMMGKDWIASYGLADRSNLRDWALIRQNRLDSVLRWKMPWLIASAPHLLHASLGLFVAGLVCLIYPLDHKTGRVAVILSGVVGLLYVGLRFSSTITTNSPFRSLGFNYTAGPSPKPSQNVLTMWLDSFVLSEIRRLNVKMHNLHDPLVGTLEAAFRHIFSLPSLDGIARFIEDMYRLLLLLRYWMIQYRDREGADTWTHVPPNAIAPTTARALDWLHAAGEPRYTTSAIFCALGDLTHGGAVFRALRSELQTQLLDKLQVDAYETRHLRAASNISLSMELLGADANIRHFREIAATAQYTGQEEDGLLALCALDGLRRAAPTHVQDLCARNSTVAIHPTTMEKLLSAAREDSSTARASADALLKSLFILNTWKGGLTITPERFTQSLLVTLPESLLATLPESLRSRHLATTLDLRLLPRELLGVLRGVRSRRAYPYSCAESDPHCDAIELLVVILRSHRALSSPPGAIAATLDLIVHISRFHPQKSITAHVNLSLTLVSSDALVRRVAQDRTWSAGDVTTVLRLTPSLYYSPDGPLLQRGLTINRPSLMMYFSERPFNADDMANYLTPALFVTMVLAPGQHWHRIPLPSSARAALDDCCLSLTRRFRFAAMGHDCVDIRCRALLRQLISEATLTSLLEARRSVLLRLLCAIAGFLCKATDCNDVFTEFAISSATGSDGTPLRHWSLLDVIPRIVSKGLDERNYKDVGDLLQALATLRTRYAEETYWQSLANAVCKACEDILLTGNGRVRSILREFSRAKEFAMPAGSTSPSANVSPPVAVPAAIYPPRIGGPFRNDPFSV